MSQESRLAGPPADPPVAELLEALHLAPRQAHKALTLWPLVRKRRATGMPPAPCIALCEALEAGSAVLHWIEPGGGVAGVRLENLGERAVLVLLDPENAGGRPLRGRPPSVLVAPHSSVVLDTSSLANEHAARSAGPRLRGLDPDSILESFHTVEDQVGFVAAAGDAVVGLEVLASPALLRSLFPDLLRGYGVAGLRAAEAMDGAPLATRRLRFAAPEPFLRALSRARWRRGLSHGDGSALHLESAGVLRGYALEAGGIAHLSAFADFGA